MIKQLDSINQELINLEKACEEAYRNYNAAYNRFWAKNRDEWLELQRLEKIEIDACLKIADFKKKNGIVENWSED